MVRKSQGGKKIDVPPEIVALVQEWADQCGLDGNFTAALISHIKLSHPLLMQKFGAVSFDRADQPVQAIAPQPAASPQPAIAPVPQVISPEPQEVIQLADQAQKTANTKAKKFMSL